MNKITDTIRFLRTTADKACIFFNLVYKYVSFHILKQKQVLQRMSDKKGN